MFKLLFAAFGWLTVALFFVKYVKPQYEWISPIIGYSFIAFIAVVALLPILMKIFSEITERNEEKAIKAAAFFIDSSKYTSMAYEMLAPVFIALPLLSYDLIFGLPHWAGSVKFVCYLIIFTFVQISIIFYYLEAWFYEKNKNAILRCNRRKTQVF